LRPEDQARVLDRVERVRDPARQRASCPAAFADAEVLTYRTGGHLPRDAPAQGAFGPHRAPSSSSYTARLTARRPSRAQYRGRLYPLRRLGRHDGRAANGRGPRCGCSDRRRHGRPRSERRAAADGRAPVRLRRVRRRALVYRCDMRHGR
jgi:hypothetical protein